MATLMVSEQQHSSGGELGARRRRRRSAQDWAQQADWGAAAKSNLFDKSDCRGRRGGQQERFTYRLLHRGFGLRRGSGVLASRRAAVRWCRLGLARGWQLGMWRSSGVAGAGLCVHFPPRDTHCGCQGQGKSAGHASVNTQLDLNAQREECCVLSWRMFLQTESVIVLMCHWWDKRSAPSRFICYVRRWIRRLVPFELMGCVCAAPRINCRRWPRGLCADMGLCKVSFRKFLKLYICMLFTLKFLLMVSKQPALQTRSCFIPPYPHNRFRI